MRSVNYIITLQLPFIKGVEMSHVLISHVPNNPANFYHTIYVHCGRTSQF